MNNEKILSLMNSQVIDIEQVSDPLFSEKMLGDGIALRPEIKTQDLYSPCDGKITTVHEAMHAVTILTHSGYEILIHVGIDTYSLKGEGFESFVTPDQEIKKGDKLLSVDFDIVSKKAPSYDVIVVVSNLSEDNILVKTKKTTVEQGEEIFFITNNKDGNLKSYEEEASSEAKEVTSSVLNIKNKAGIHARPASVIFQISKKFNSEIEIIQGDKTASAKSIVAILGLSIKYNDNVQIKAVGEDAESAVAEITKSIQDGLGEEVSKTSFNTNKIAEKKEEIIDNFENEVVLQGTTAIPGIVKGISFFISEEEFNIAEHSEDSNEELNLLNRVISDVKNKITKNIEQAESLDQTNQAEIYLAHLNILEDPIMLLFAKNKIKEGKTAAFSWKEAIDHSIKVIKQTENQLLIERIADFKDLEKMVISSILGKDQEQKHYPENSIIVAEDLVPSDLTNFDENVKGILLSSGSTTSHVSLILRNKGTPTIVAVGPSVLNIPNGTPIMLVLDGKENKVYVNPDQETISNLEIQQRELEKIKQENISNAKKPAITTDNKNISVKANISKGEEAKEAFDLGAEGVGLLRTELLFFQTFMEPSISDQHKLYQLALDNMQGNSVILRTLDVGGDKPVPFIHIDHEENPIMGVRGLRSYFSNKDVFLNQIRAILKVKPLFLSKIMVPMVSEISEFLEIKQMIADEKKDLGISEDIEIGTMVEVPSVAIMADKFAKYVDFLSIGTNDLVQYTLAIDRGNSKLTHKLKNLNPSVLRLINNVVKAGKEHNKPVSVCGAMASEIVSIPILIGLGVENLSCSIRAIPYVKALIRKISYDHCVSVAQKALDMESAERVISLVNEEFKGII